MGEGVKYVSMQRRGGIEKGITVPKEKEAVVFRALVDEVAT